MVFRAVQQLMRATKSQQWKLPPTQATHRSGGSNLEVFKFGVYIMFPIAWMWYFGTNLDARFSVPDFWPEPGTTHKLPFEREELAVLAERLKADRLERRRRRLGREGRKEAEEEAGDQVAQVEQRTLVGGANGTFEVGSIE